MSPDTRNASPPCPFGYRILIRFAGLASSATGTRYTAAISAVSTGATGPGDRHQPITGVTRNPLRGM